MRDRHEERVHNVLRVVWHSRVVVCDLKQCFMAQSASSRVPGTCEQRHSQEAFMLLSFVQEAVHEWEPACGARCDDRLL